MMRLPVTTAQPEVPDTAIDGWVKQFSASDPRLSEMVGVFQSMGKEIKLERECGDNLLFGECKACMESHPSGVWSIWTRDSPEGNSGNES